MCTVSFHTWPVADIVCSPPICELPLTRLLQLTSHVQALDVIQKGKRVASALSQSCTDFDSLGVRLMTPLQACSWSDTLCSNGVILPCRLRSKQTWLRLISEFRQNAEMYAAKRCCSRTVCAHGIV